MHTGACCLGGAGSPLGTRGRGIKASSLTGQNVFAFSDPLLYSDKVSVEEEPEGGRPFSSLGWCSLESEEGRCDGCAVVG